MVAPSSVLPNWDSEFKRWAPALKVVAFRGNPQERLRIATTEVCSALALSSCIASMLWILGLTLYSAPQMRGKFNVVLTTYEALMGADMPFLSKIRWHHFIIDEGHRLKNSECKLNVSLKVYSTQHRLLLTGLLSATVFTSACMLPNLYSDWHSEMQLMCDRNTSAEQPG